ncbi:uncharacterized protein LY89DRAFT_231544 [Mollisia scopiformis]|uniref:Uncharacterized protein n=1 Tax=Mollisia scopiformis TaxID=149040 RepID=A0A194WUU9_MOLSC|nr:uncharacterized protein LY89DRAFT_231544 [Mollisia scopiformis]KUJ11743.1 hypothetical protein LY89DRAFT_231544 [Mollisia scopiformis]
MLVEFPYSGFLISQGLIRLELESIQTTRRMAMHASRKRTKQNVWYVTIHLWSTAHIVGNTSIFHYLREGRRLPESTLLFIRHLALCLVETR